MSGKNPFLGFGMVSPFITFARASIDALYRAAGGKPTLDQRFAKDKTLVDKISGNNLITFSRASSGTYVDSDGLIKNSPVNLLTYSEQFDQSAWAKQASVVLTPNSIAAPDGTTTGALYSLSASTQRAIDQSISGLTNGVTYTFSIYVKAIVNTTLRIRTQTDNSTLLDRQILASDGWQRIQVSFIKDSGRTSIGFFDISGNTGDRFYIWGAQLEEGTATDYIPTGATISGAPRFDHDPVTGESLGLLIEEERTNKILRSENLISSSSYWRTQSGAITTLSSVTGPDGVSNMWLVDLSDTPGTTGDGSRVYQSSLAFNNVVNTFSFYARSVSGTGTFPVAYYDGSNYIKSYVTLTETIQRYEVSCPSGLSTTSTNIFGFSRRGLTHNETLTQAYIWGCQLEAAPYASSYIPTDLSTVTRSPDVASIEGTNFSSWYNQSEGTVFVELGSEQGSAPTHFQLTGAGGVDRIQSRKSQLYCFNGTEQFNLSYTSSLKEASAFSGTSTSVAVSGSVVATHGAASLPTCTNIELGKSAGLDYLNGHISRLAYFPARKTDQELVNMTS